MSSMRGGYKAKLRDAFTKESLRETTKFAREKNKETGLSKRRQLSDDMSPVVENYGAEARSTHTGIKPRAKTAKGSSKDKPDTVLEKLKYWREEKKRKQELEKASMVSKSKPVFKAGALSRQNEAELYAKPKSALQEEKNKVAGKADHTAKQVPKVAAKPKTVVQTKETKKPAGSALKKSVSLIQPSKKPVAPGPSTSKPQKMTSTKSTGDLSSRLTAAAAAKAKMNSSPKKFLRATRASTLQKKEPAKGVKGQKGPKDVSKLHGNLLTQKEEENKVEFQQTDLLKKMKDRETSKGFDFSSGSESDSGKRTRQIPETFDFSQIANDTNKNALIVDASGQNNEETQLSPELTEKSVAMLAVTTNHVMNDEDAEVVFTPRDTTKNNTRKSTRLSAVVATQPEMEVEGTISSPLRSPKRSTRKSMRVTMSASKQPVVLEEIETVMPELALSTTPKLPRRKSTRNSKAWGMSAGKQFEQLNISGQKTEESLSDKVTSMSVTRTPKRKSMRGSHVAVVDTASEESDDMLEFKDDIQMVSAEIGIDEAVSKKSFLTKRKSMRKSTVQEEEDVLQQTAEALGEQTMEVDMESKVKEVEADTQTLVNDLTSTPKSHRQKSMGSSQRKDRSLIIQPLFAPTNDTSDEVASSTTPKSRPRKSRGRKSAASVRKSMRRSVATPAIEKVTSGSLDSLNMSGVENIPRAITPRHSNRKSTVVSVSHEGTAVGRNLELALSSYTVEKPPLSAKASRILNELVIEKVDGENSFFEVSFDESVSDDPGSQNKSMKSSSSGSLSTLPFTPQKSVEVASTDSSLTSMVTPKSNRKRHSTVPSSGFKEPGMPLSALRSAGRRKTEHTPSKTPRQMINILKKSPMIEMNRRRSKTVTPPSPAKGQYFRDLVTTETDRFNVLCGKWNEYVTQEQGLSEDVCGQIRCAVGKALLLIEQRFKQFSGLIDNFVYDMGENKTTPTDLQGFWDMIYFQVEDVHSMFKELEDLKEANWQVKEKSPKPKGLVLKKTAPKAKANTKKVKSNFAAFKAEMLKKKAAQATAPVVDAATDENMEIVTS